MPPDQKLDANAMTRAIFGKNATRREFASALIYRLRRKGSLESNADNTSISPQLLVIWRYDNRYEYSVRVMLIKHGNAIILNEDELKKLDYPHSTLLRNGRNIKNKWLLDNATVSITSKWEKQINTIKIAISEGNGEKDSMKPIYVPSNM
jgi:hypothetical protein